MTFAVNVQNLATRIGTEFKALRTLISGTGTGGVGGLATTATDLVAAINEVKSTADSALGGGTTINDLATNATQAWSSQKIDTEISSAVSGLVDLATVQSEASSAASTAVANLVDGSPATLDTLNELAAALGDDPNFAATITASVGLKANAADVYTQAQLGDPSTNYVTTFEAALT